MTHDMSFTTDELRTIRFALIGQMDRLRQVMRVHEITLAQYKGMSPERREQLCELHGIQTLKIEELETQIDKINLMLEQEGTVSVCVVPF